MSGKTESTMRNELIESAKAVCDLVEAQGGHGMRVHALVDALRAAVRAAEAAPAADTVVVPVETLRRWSTTGDVVFAKGSLCAPVPLTEIRNLLPPPPAPEPSAELVAEWRKEAESYWNATRRADGWDYIRKDDVKAAFVAARRAEWAKKGGG